MTTEETVETKQELAERRRKFNIGKDVTPTIKVKLDRQRELSFKAQNIAKMELMLGLKSWQIVSALDNQDWGSYEIMAALWVGLLPTYEDITLNDVYAIWNATPIPDRTKAVLDAIYGLIEGAGLEVDSDIKDMMFKKWVDDRKIAKEKLLKAMEELFNRIIANIKP